MSLKQELNLSQRTSLVMTPKLRQALGLLQMSHLELNDFLEHELQENPFLEVEEGRADNDEGIDQDPLETTSVNDNQEEELQYSNENIDTDASCDEFDHEDSNLWSLDSVNNNNSFSDFEREEAYLEEDISLRDFLIEQVGLEVADQRTRMIALYLIDLLDDSGYLRVDLAPIAKALNCSLLELEKTLVMLKDLEPVGVFAKDLGECMALQLKDQGLLTDTNSLLLQNLDLLAQCEFKKLTKLLNVDIETLKKMITLIRTLNPKPAEEFESARIPYIKPDVFIRKLSKGGWSVDLNSDLLPKVTLNTGFYNQVKTKTKTETDKSYLNEKFGSASWLMKATLQRSETIMRVSQEILRQQEAFFEKGIQHLKPLKMKEISEALGIHESTVSRVTTNKFMSTPRGIFELKYFFNSSVQSGLSANISYSSETVRHRIKDLILKEGDHILSDEKIVDLLTGQGISIARRTVAKYRDILKIPSSAQRKRALRKVI
ncbi:MAG: RNA polymerase factor sigma-54 [Alphaproteobacteria bacterium]